MASAKRQPELERSSSHIRNNNNIIIIIIIIKHLYSVVRSEAVEALGVVQTDYM